MHGQTNLKIWSLVWGKNIAEGVCKHGAEDDNEPKREEEIDQKKLHRKQLHKLYFSQNIIMRFNSRIEEAYGMNGRKGNFMPRFVRKTSR
jgi:hypothetical protein